MATAKIVLLTWDLKISDELISKCLLRVYMPVKHSLKSIPFLSSILTLMEKMHKSTFLYKLGTSGR